MKKMKAFTFAAGLAVFASAVAETLTVGDDPARRTLGDGYTLTPSTVAFGSGQLPDGVPTPAFWLDASDRTGWAYKDNDGTQVTNVPSKVGNRYLTASTAGGDWGSWTLGAPVLCTDNAKLGGGKYLDFGAYGSCRGLVFNPLNGHTALTNVASVVAVYGSQRGGGFLLGGGYTPGSGYAFSRNGTGTHNANDNPGYEGTVFDGNARAFFQNGLMRHSGNITNPRSGTGFAGDWEVLAFTATSAEGEATGIGLNDARTSSRSGGMMIAEMLIFNEILTAEQCAKLEAYLAKKWFGNPMIGYAGDAHASMIRSAQTNTASPYPTHLAVSAAAGEKLTIDHLYGGGYGGSGLVKTGAGALELGSAAIYGGNVRLQGGTLEFTRIPIPAEMPSNYVFRLDGSAPDTIVTETHDGTNDWVVMWNNIADVSFKGDRPLGATNKHDRTDIPAYCQPRVHRDAFGTGKHIVDFGSWMNNWLSSDYVLGKAGDLQIWGVTESTGAGKSMNIPRVTTVLAVMSAHGGGGTLVSIAGADSTSIYSRGNAAADITVAIAKNKQSLTQGGYATSAVPTRVFVDGARVDATAEGYRTYGWQVVALQLSSANIRTIGAMGGDWYSGGMQIAELLMYDRILSDREIKDAQALLAKKWFGTDIPGYEAADSARKTADLQQVTVEAASTIDVKRGTARIGKLAVNAPLVKTGAGTLDVQSISDLSAIEVREGQVRTVAVPDPTAKLQLAEDPSLHVDAAATNTMCLWRKNGSDYVTRWCDLNGRNMLTTRSVSPSSVTEAPTLSYDDTALVNGHPVVKCAVGQALAFSRSIDNARSAFVILGSQDGGGNVFGSYKQALDGDNCKRNDFRRGGSLNGRTASDPILYNTDANYPLLTAYGGSVLTNGVAVNPLSAGLSGGYQLIEYHAAVGMHMSAICTAGFGWLNDVTGCGRYGEIVVYERELSDREKTATRNYLLNKWFGTPAAELADLPGEVPVAPAYENVDIALDGEELAMEVAEGETVRRAIEGDGDFTKTGEGTLTVKDISRFAGTLNVEAGTLAVTGLLARTQAKLPTAGRILHVDASDPAAGTASPFSGKKSASLYLPDESGSDTVKIRCGGQIAEYVENAQNGKAIVRFGTGTGYANFLDGEEKTGSSGAITNFTGLTNIRSALWVIGSANGGGVLLGGYTNNVYSANKYLWPYDRDHDDHTQPLLAESSLAELQSQCTWHMNGEAINPRSKGLSGAFDQISMVVNAESEFTAIAGGLAMNGYGGLVYSQGAQDVAEIILYDRKLNDGERVEAEAYLEAKWGLNNRQWNATNLVDLALASGAFFDCGGTTQYVASVTGAGTVQNGVLTTSKLVYDFANPGTLTVNGTFGVGGNFTVIVENRPASVKSANIKLVDATDFAGDYSGATVSGVPENITAKVRLRSDGLYLTLAPPGFTIMVR